MNFLILGGYHGHHHGGPPPSISRGVSPPGLGFGVSRRLAAAHADGAKTTAEGTFPGEALLGTGNFHGEIR